MKATSVAFIVSSMSDGPRIACCLQLGITGSRSTKPCTWVDAIGPAGHDLQSAAEFLNMLVPMLQVNQDFTFEENQLQVAFVAGGIWALRFPSKPTYEKFCREYEAKLFENMTGLAYNETNQAKV